MPIFEYRCRECGAKFERIAQSSEDAASCKQCGSERVDQLLSVFAVGSRPGTTPAEPGPCGACGAPGAAYVENDLRTPSCVTTPPRLEQLSLPWPSQPTPAALFARGPRPECFLSRQICSDANVGVPRSPSGLMFMTCITFLHLTRRGCQCQTPSLANALPRWLRISAEARSIP